MNKARQARSVVRWAEAVHSLCLGYRVNLWVREGVNARGYLSAPDGSEAGFVATHEKGDLIYRTIKQPHRTILRDALRANNLTIPRHGQTPCPTKPTGG